MMNGKVTTSFAIILWFGFRCGLTATAQQPGTYQTANFSNVRAEPTTRSNIVTSLVGGEQVQVTASVNNDSWYQVQLADGRVGYMYHRLLIPVSANAAQAAAAPVATVTTGSATSGAGEDAAAYFITPFDGEKIPGGKLWVRFGLRGMGVAPAGVEKQFTGHHHLLVNTGLPPLDEAIPSDDNHIHFGRGQTEYFLELPPGEHTLQLLLGDHLHVPHQPPVMSKQITVYVP